MFNKLPTKYSEYFQRNVFLTAWSNTNLTPTGMYCSKFQPDTIYDHREHWLPSDIHLLSIYSTTSSTHRPMFRAFTAELELLHSAHGNAIYAKPPVTTARDVNTPAPKRYSATCCCLRLRKLKRSAGICVFTSQPPTAKNTRTLSDPAIGWSWGWSALMTPPEIALQNKRGIEREIRKTRTKLQNPCHPIGKKVDLGVFVCVSVSKTPFSCCCSRLGQSERNSILRDDTLLTEGPLNEAKGHADGRRLSLFLLLVGGLIGGLNSSARLYTWAAI